MKQEPVPSFHYHVVHAEVVHARSCTQKAKFNIPKGFKLPKLGIQHNDEMLVCVKTLRIPVCLHFVSQSVNSLLVE